MTHCIVTYFFCHIRANASVDVFAPVQSAEEKEKASKKCPHRHDSHHGLGLCITILSNVSLTSREQNDLLNVAADVITGKTGQQIHYKETAEQ